MGDSRHILDRWDSWLVRHMVQCSEPNHRVERTGGSLHAPSSSWARFPLPPVAHAGVGQNPRTHDMSLITYPGIRGSLRIVATGPNDESERIYIEGDVAGLRSLAALITKLAEVDQATLNSLPSKGASEHIHVKRARWLTPDSAPEVVISRLDDKNGEFDETFVPRRTPPRGDIIHRW
jgi:hypothetical protein